MRAGSPELRVEFPAPPIRLRYVLVLAIVGVVVWSAIPRLRAAWQLPTAATLLADYALCMVGPTGPGLLRDNPAGFRELVRRRLVTSAPDDHPFARCAKAAEELSGSSVVGRAHQAVAVAFAEFGGGTSELALSDTEVSTRRLGELADAAWPFVRDGYTSRVKASAYAHEAPHPAELPVPGVARGAPPAPSVLSTGRCDLGAGRAMSLGVAADHRTHVAVSTAPEGVTESAPFARIEARLVAAACDESTLVVAAVPPGSREPAFFTCGFLAGCSAMPGPRLGAKGPAVAAPLDLARVSGVTIVAARMGRVVRVSSSRDEGRTWTPFVVAFDEDAHPGLRADVKAPDRLSVAGRRVFLHGASARASATYPVLVSDDSGASFHAP